VVAPGRSYFDTNTGHHHHFFVEPDGELHDFPSDKVTIAGLPVPPKGTRLARVDVIVRVRR
jgi:Fur family iron response transcriptional regulator